MRTQCDCGLVHEVRFHRVFLRIAIIQVDFAIAAGTEFKRIADIDRLENRSQVVVAVLALADDIEEQVDFCRCEFFHGH